MNTNHKLALAGLAGVLIGVGGALCAQQVKTAPAYVVPEAGIVHPTGLRKYSENVTGTIAAFHGRILAAG